MRALVLIAALAMPVIAWLSQMEVFGPDQATVSARYPIVLVPAGYAFSIWGLVFLLDLVHAVRQTTGRRRHDPLLGRVAPATAIGFGLTALWMPLYAQEWLWACLAVIVGAWASLLWTAVALARGGGDGWARLAIPLHAGWLTLATFLNLAQAGLGAGLLPADDQLGWSLGLLAVAAAVLLAANRVLRGDAAYAAAAIWGLAAIHVEQSHGALAGAGTVAWAAAALAALLALQTLWLRLRKSRRHAHL